MKELLTYRSQARRILYLLQKRLSDDDSGKITLDPFVRKSIRKQIKYMNSFIDSLNANISFELGKEYL